MQPVHASYPLLCIAIVAGEEHIGDIEKEMKMSTNINRMRGGFIGRAIAVFGAAAHASAAVENGRNPRKQDLVRLGMDPTAFDLLRSR